MKTFYREFTTLMNFLYWLPMFISVVIVIALSTVIIWWGGDYFKIKKIYKIIANVIAVALAVFIIPLHWTVPAKQAQEKRIVEYNERKEKYEEAKAVFDEQCKKAGEKIYRTVDNVDGVMLLKIWEESDNRSRHTVTQDQMWKYAGYVNYDIASNKGYISIFIQKYKKDFNNIEEIGYKYIDVPNEEKFTHYTGEYNGRSWHTDPSNEEIISKSSARYAVTFETDVSPELRKYWVAGVTFKIIDLQTNELLAEKTVFNFSQTLGKRMHGLSWVADNLTCGTDGKTIGEFTFSVLKPQP